MTWGSPRLPDVASITDSVRSDIVAGRLPSGREIVIADVSEDLGAAMSDVRQALLRLADQRLVVESPDGSFRVVSTSRQDLSDLTAMRQLLEGEAVRLTVLRADASWAEKVRSAYRELDEAGEAVLIPGLTTAWREAHTAFHEALCVNAGNDRLLRSVRALRDEAEIYRELSAAAMTQERRETVDREHRELFQLAIEGRADDAATALRAHLEGTKQSVVQEALGGGPS